MSSVVIAGLGLRFYYVREMVASMVLFSLLFVLTSLVVLTGFSLWYVVVLMKSRLRVE